MSSQTIPGENEPEKPVSPPPQQAIPPKPRAEVYRPELTGLPVLTRRRRLARWLIRGVCRLAVKLCSRYKVFGTEYFPAQGPALVVVNHLGDADAVIGMGLFPVSVDGLVKMELYDIPIFGKVLDAYGAIWVHRGSPDRHALRNAIDLLEQGRIVSLAPEGRESLTGALEEGTGGAAYLALKAKVPLIPVTFTGTENWRIYGNLKRLRRTDISVTIGPPFWLEESASRREAIRRGTALIMMKLAQQLPQEYRGVYQNTTE